MKTGKSSFRFALLLISMIWAVGAQALVIITPIDYNTANLVGTADPGNASANVGNELIWANQILALAVNTTATILEPLSPITRNRIGMPTDIKRDPSMIA